jgi:tRNA A-37 threonylcarbamoyl transferase component Bud32
MVLLRFDAQTVVGYLRRRGLLAGREGRIRVLDVSRRNHNLEIEIDGRPKWFVKQMQHLTPEVIASLKNEANCYQVAWADEALASVRSMMPKCADFDGANSILVLEFVDGVDAAEAHLRVGAFDVRLAELLGHTVGRLHAQTPVLLRSSMTAGFHRSLPWVLQPPAEAYPSSRARYVARFLEQEGIARSFAAIRAGWKADTVIHGDTRLENFILCRSSDSKSGFEVKLVDWELADMGDPLWDCAGVMQHYLVQWVEQHAPTPRLWEQLNAALGSFWRAYRIEAGSDRGGQQVLRKLTLLTGARLVQAGYEHLANSRPDTPYIENLARLMLTETDGMMRGFEWGKES